MISVEAIFMATTYMELPPKNKNDVLRLFFLNQRRYHKDYHPKTQEYYDHCYEFLSRKKYDWENKFVLLAEIQALSGGRLTTLDKSISYWIECWENKKWCPSCKKRPRGKKLHKLCPSCFSNAGKLMYVEEVGTGSGGSGQKTSFRKATKQI